MVLSAFGDWISDLFTKLNDWLIGITQFDNRLWYLYDKTIAPLSEWVKLFGSLILIITLIFGIFALIKKAYKVVIVVAVIYAIFIGLSFLT